MKRLVSLIWVVICLVVATPSFGASDQRPIHLKMATQYMDRHPVYQYAWKEWFQEIKKRTNGRVIIDFYNPNTIIPDAEILDATLKGQIDIGDHYLTRLPGRFPLGVVTSKIPLPGTSVLATSMAFWELWQTTPEIQAEFKGLKILGLHHSAAGHVSMRKKPIYTVDDLKGQRLACIGKASVDIVEAFGATPLMMPGPELYLALSRNMADGVIYPLPPMRSFKINEATKYTSLFYFLSSPCWFAMNQAKWDSLPPDIQKVFDETTGEVMTRAIAAAIEKGEKIDYEIMKKDGQEFIVPSDEETAKAFDMLVPVVKSSWMKELAATKSTYADPTALYDKACNLLKKYNELYGQK